MRYLILLMYDWSRNAHIYDITHEYTISEHSVIDWFRFLRDICIERMFNFESGRKIGNIGGKL